METSRTTTPTVITPKKDCVIAVFTENGVQVGHLYTGEGVAINERNDATIIWGTLFQLVSCVIARQDLFERHEELYVQAAQAKDENLVDRENPNS